MQHVSVAIYPSTRVGFLMPRPAALSENVVSARVIALWTSFARAPHLQLYIFQIKKKLFARQTTVSFTII